MADFLENDLDIGALTEQQLGQKLEQGPNDGANRISFPGVFWIFRCSSGISHDDN